MARALPPTSLVLALVPGETPPDEALVRAALDLESGDLALAEPEDWERAGGSTRDSDSLWSFHVESAGVVFRVAAERAPPLHEWHLEQARWGESEGASERVAAENARYALSVEGRLEEPPLRSLRDQLALALELGGESCPAVWDEGSLRLWPASALRRLLGSKAGLGIHELASLHAIGGESAAAWIHTHGLARAGLPELDALQVPRSAQGPVGELLQATASLLLEHGTPATGKPFPVGESMDVVLLGLDDALARVPKDAPGGRGARDDEHREGSRVVVAPASARQGGSPSLEPLAEAARKGPFFRSVAATERMRVLARERWGEFVRLFHQNHRKPGFVFLAKLGYEPDGKVGEASREHLWFRVQAIEDDRIEGLLESTPVAVSSLERGTSRKHDLERLSEWVVVTPAGRLFPDTPG